MASNLPTLPKIDGESIDLVLDVYTHRSLRPDLLQPNPEYGDTDRLAELGGKILELAVTYQFYSKKPMLTASQIADESRKALCDEQIQSWLANYGLRNNFRYDASVKDDANSPEELRRFFNTYVGAAYIRNGMSVIQDWISRLVDPDADPAPNYPGLDSSGSSWGIPQPHPPTSSPPPLPTSVPSSSNPAPPNLLTLALVNQTAAQRGYTITYLAEQTGLSHLPTWTVRCCRKNILLVTTACAEAPLTVNGIEQGRGVAKSQKLAKEEAARQAWIKMHW